MKTHTLPDVAMRCEARQNTSLPGATTSRSPRAVAPGVDCGVPRCLTAQWHKRPRTSMFSQFLHVSREWQQQKSFMLAVSGLTPLFKGHARALTGSRKFAKPPCRLEAGNYAGNYGARAWSFGGIGSHRVTITGTFATAFPRTGRATFLSIQLSS